MSMSQSNCAKSSNDSLYAWWTVTAWDVKKLKNENEKMKKLANQVVIAHNLSNLLCG